MAHGIWEEMMMANVRIKRDQAVGGRAIIGVYDGARQPYSDEANLLLVTAIDGNQKQQRQDFFSSPNIFLTGLPLFDNLGDNYTFLVSADGYKNTGLSPVKLSPNVDEVIDLMLIPKSNALNFSDARWEALGQSWPDLKTLLSNGATTDAEASNRYSDIMEDNEGLILACLLNITSAMRQIHLPQKTPFDYLKGMIWDRDGGSKMAQDRFFAWADPELINQIERAKRQVNPVFTNAPFALHPSATRSYKEIQFGEANVQFTFHENDRSEVDGVNCVKVEPDIDYFKNLLNHGIMEVLVNAGGSLTDPKTVYVLRWMAGRHAGVAEFNPLYTIQRS